MSTTYPKYAAAQARRDAIAKAERKLGACVIHPSLSRSEARLLLAAIERVDLGNRDNGRMDKIAQRIAGQMAEQMAADMERINAEFPA